MKLRILLADDHEIVRRGLCSLLQKHEGWEVCGEASDGREAIEMAKQLKPDVVIVDIGMPHLNGLDTTRQLLQHDSAFKVIVLTITDSDQVIREALNAGARGFVLKSDAARDLVSAVEALQNNRMFFTPRVNDLVMAGFLDKGHTIARNEPPDLPILTARERDTSQQHNAETQPALDPRSGCLCHQEQHHPDPNATSTQRQDGRHTGLGIQADFALLGRFTPALARISLTK